MSVDMSIAISVAVSVVVFIAISIAISVESMPLATIVDGSNSLRPPNQQTQMPLSDAAAMSRDEPNPPVYWNHHPGS